MTNLILGTWQLNPPDLFNYFRNAFTIGYNTIDCAEIYQNEAEIGEYLTAAMSAAGLDRSNICISSKVWNNCHQDNDVERALDRSLKSLGITYLDCYFIHWPLCWQRGVTFPSKPADFLSDQRERIEASICTLAEMKRKGKIKEIGLSNFGPKRLETVYRNTGIRADRVQVECHFNLQQTKLRKYCVENDISFEGYSILGNTRLANQENLPPLSSNESVAQVAKQTGKTIATLSLNWASQANINCLMTTSSMKHMQDNYDAFFGRDIASNIGENIISSGIRYTNANSWLALTDGDAQKFWDRELYIDEH